MSEKWNDNITQREAKTILETVTWLCRNCALTHIEASKIAKVCQDCLERLEQEGDCNETN
jgi:hypothetical protein